MHIWKWLAPVFLISCGLTYPALAQRMPNLPSFGGNYSDKNAGPEPSQDSTLLRVIATRPVVIRSTRYTILFEPSAGFVRMVFRVTATGQPTPYSTIGYGGARSDFILDWDAYSSSGAHCVLVRGAFFGADVFSGGTIGAAESLRDLIQQDGARTIATATRATIVRADFSCDSRVRAGETMTVQIKFFVLGPYGWRTAVYSFDDMQVGASG